MPIYSTHPTPTDITMTDQALYVVSCGCDENLATHIHRPQGRDDYHLLYMATGSGACSVNGSKRTLLAGQCVLYHPFEQHTYTFSTDAPFRRYWIHFSGNQVKNYMTELGLHHVKHMTISDPARIESCFTDIIQELLIQDNHYIKTSTGHLLRLLSMLARDNDGSSKQHITRYHRFKDVVYYIHTHYTENVDVQTYATLCHLSKYRFIVNFKKFTGYTPIDYRNKIRIDHARQMLTECETPLYLVAEQLGFHSAPYFTTVFKRFCGCSPRAYRQSIISQQN